MGPQYTRCFGYRPGDRPFNEKDLVALMGKNTAIGLSFGGLTGVVVGLLVGNLVIGLLVGAFAAGYTAASMAIAEGSYKWLYHRLVCLGGRQCAVGTVKGALKIAELGELDNDEYFDLALMPYPPDKAFETAGDPEHPAASAAARKALSDHPANDVIADGFQGARLVRPREDLLRDLGYVVKKDIATHELARFTRNWLHCEAEGDFWARMADLASAMGVLGGVGLAAATAGAIAGATIGCALGLAFFGIGCLIGGIIGAIIGGLAAGALAYVAAKAIVNVVFKTNQGDVEDANIGEGRLGTIGPGDRVVVFGEHVYDGFHEGWHEIHPLLTICKLATFELEGRGPGHSFYLQWTPDFPPGGTPPNLDLPGLALPKLSAEDMRQGLESDAFRARATALRDRWCELLGERFKHDTVKTQQQPQERWTIHPAVDGCRPAIPSSPGLR